MAEYLTPGVFVEDIKQVVNMPVGSAPVAAFIGVAATGPVGVPTLITSWNAYLNTFAIGQDSAFLANSKLAYAVYGFFQNGGIRCYVQRVSDKSSSSAYKAKSSTATVSDVAFEAISEGDWGDKITVEIPASEYNDDVTPPIFTLKVKYNGSVVESWGNLKDGVNIQGCFADVINSESNYIKVTDLTKQINKPSADISVSFTGGEDGLATSGAPVPDAVYKESLKQFDFMEDIRLVAIPGASNTLQVDVAEYCTNNKYRIAICEGQETDTDSALQSLRNSLDGKNAVLYTPWIKVVNPLSSSGALIAVPACGHICGVYSRISDARGFWKAPAGTEAVIRGAVDVQKIYTLESTNVLNPKGINALLPKTNYGICVWGARSCNPEFNYVSDLYMNITLKKNIYDLTQRFVFEPHDSTLWTKVRTTCQDYLNSLYQQGAFFGENAGEAYYVKCDEDLNPVSVRNQGKLICEIGYATKKPAEFIVFRISHELTTA